MMDVWQSCTRRAEPAWTFLRDGLRPPPPFSGEPGEWQHGWQYHASSPIEHHHKETVKFAESDAAGSRAFPRRSRCRKCIVRSTNSNRVQGGTTPLPHTGARTTAPSSVGDGSTWRVRAQSGHFRPPFRQVQSKGRGVQTAHWHECVGSGSDSLDEHEAPRYDRLRAGTRSEGHRSAPKRPSAAPQNATRRRRIEVCPCRVRVRTAEFNPYGRRHPHRCTQREGAEVPRTVGERPVPLDCCRDGGDDGPGCLQCLAGGRSPRLWCPLGRRGRRPARFGGTVQRSVRQLRDATFDVMSHKKGLMIIAQQLP